MPQSLVAFCRGRSTLPVMAHRRFGIKLGNALTLEDCGGEFVLNPGLVLEIQHYSDDQIAQWDIDDGLEDQERTGILDAVIGLK